MNNKIFINRRKGTDRREDMDPCSDLDVDLYHRKRRKRAERRQQRTLDEDYYAFLTERDPSDDQSPEGVHH